MCIRDSEIYLAPDKHTGTGQSKRFVFGGLAIQRILNGLLGIRPLDDCSQIPQYEFAELFRSCVPLADVDAAGSYALFEPRKLSQRVLSLTDVVASCHSGRQALHIFGTAKVEKGVAAHGGVVEDSVE